MKKKKIAKEEIVQTSLKVQPCQTGISREIQEGPGPADFKISL
jgi:hypothetical protein